MTHSREHQHVEWKETWRDDYLKWISGFANADGGTLVIGRDDRGRAVGARDAARLLEEIPNKVRDLLGIMVDVNLTHEAGSELIEIVVAPYPYPVSYKGEYHYRSGSTKQELRAPRSTASCCASSGGPGTRCRCRKSLRPTCRHRRWGASVSSPRRAGGSTKRRCWSRPMR